MSAGDTSEVMSNGKLVKPLSELSVYEVGIVLEALKVGKYKAALISNEIDGKCLMKCHTVEDAVNMGIKIFVKAHVFLDNVMIWKASGVPMEYFSVDQATNREDNDTEDMIALMKVVVMIMTIERRMMMSTLKLGMVKLVPMIMITRIV